MLRKEKDSAYLPLKSYMGCCHSNRMKAESNEKLLVIQILSLFENEAFYRGSASNMC
jgi:hypothetical protein